MNRTRRSIAATFVLAGALFASVPAHADDSFTARVGRVIAEQGNAALATIREEIKDTLMDRITPFLPADPKSGDENDPAEPAA